MKHFVSVCVHTHTEAQLWFSRRSSVITDSGYKSGFRGVWNLSSPVSVCGAFMSRSLRPGRVSFQSPSKLPDGESCRRPHSVVLNRESVYVCVCVCVCVWVFKRHSVFLFHRKCIPAPTWHFVPRSLSWGRRSTSVCLLLVVSSFRNNIFTVCGAFTVWASTWGKKNKKPSSGGKRDFPPHDKCFKS